MGLDGQVSRHVSCAARGVLPLGNEEGQGKQISALVTRVPHQN